MVDGWAGNAGDTIAVVIISGLPVFMSLWHLAVVPSYGGGENHFKSQN